MILNLAHPEKSDIKYEIINFPDGQKHLRLLGDPACEVLNIEARLRSFDELFLLGQAIDICHLRVQHLYVDISYLLGARSDRAFSPNEAFSLKIVADYLNLFADKIDALEVLEPHSFVTTSLIKNCSPLWFRHESYHCPTALKVLPDRGAAIRFRHYGGLEHFTVCDKKRNPQTGEINGFELKEPIDFRGHPCFVMDDLCDGGATFIGVAKLLRAHGAGDLYLSVVHGIFSKGFHELRKHYKHIYTTNSFQDLESNEFLTVTEVI